MPNVEGSNRTRIAPLSVEDNASLGMDEEGGTARVCVGKRAPEEAGGVVCEPVGWNTTERHVDKDVSTKRVAERATGRRKRE